MGGAGGAELARREYMVKNRHHNWSLSYRRRAISAGYMPKDFGVYEEELIARDGPGCVMCGLRGLRLELDHIVAVGFGGSHAPWNCRLVCQPCHKSRRKEETAHRKRLRAEGALPEKRK